MRPLAVIPPFAEQMDAVLDILDSAADGLATMEQTPERARRQSLVESRCKDFRPSIVVRKKQSPGYPEGDAFL